MSGGSYSYVYLKVEDFIHDLKTSIQAEATDIASDINTEIRSKFVKHLELVAAAMKAIEWVDSGDCSPPHDEEAIKLVLGDQK